MFRTMFAIPGIAGLIVFLLVRPQEFLPLLQRVPFLHLFTAFAMLGWVLDVRLKRVDPTPTPGFRWVVAFLAWYMISTAGAAPENLIARVLDIVIMFAIYGTIAHGVQTFRTFQTLAGVVVAATMFIALVCFHQGLSNKQCIGGEDGVTESSGTPDGRECDTPETCHGPGAEPGFEYRCEHVGMFGTTSIEERVRYRGDLHDPNEVSLTISGGGLALLIAFMRRKRDPFAKLVCLGGAVVAVSAIYMTQSRGGLMSALLVPGVYILRRYGLAGVIVAAMLAVPVLMSGSRGGEAADVSTQLRYEAWGVGLQLFYQHPLFGVGAHMFDHHHYLTAHNSLVLALTELGFIGLFLFSTIIYLSFKTLIVGLFELNNVPGTAAAQVWGMSLLAALAGIVFQSLTLSFSYHPVLWIFFAMIGAWGSAIRHHRPSFAVRINGNDVFWVIVGCMIFVFIGLPIFLRLKHA
jgi:O-Antigen ligase